jgi:hypothetical protein
MRDEDLDWEIYHALLDGKARTAAALAACGYDPGIVEASLCRLEKALLIERSGDAVRPLSFEEAILLCQVKNERDCPLVLENGVIRVKTSGERKG